MLQCCLRISIPSRHDTPTRLLCSSISGQNWEMLFWWGHKKPVWCQTTIAASKTQHMLVLQQVNCMHNAPASLQVLIMWIFSQKWEYKVSKLSNSPHPVPLRSHSRRKAELAHVPSGPRLVHRPLGCSSEWENDSRERCQTPTAWLPSLERLRTGHSHHKQTKYSVQEKEPHAKAKTTQWEMSSRYRRRGSSWESGQPHKEFTCLSPRTGARVFAELRFSTFTFDVKSTYSGAGVRSGRSGETEWIVILTHACMQ